VEEHKVRFIDSERFVYSRRDNFVGKFDFTMEADGGVCMGDLKTGNGLYPTVAMQTAAYAKAYTEETGSVIVGRWAIRVAKETETEYLDRIYKKNASRERRGLKPHSVKPYVAFEARFFSNETLDRDYDAFLLCNKLTDGKNATASEFRNDE
jgi:hypothetical protein